MQCQLKAPTKFSSQGNTDCEKIKRNRNLYINSTYQKQGSPPTVLFLSLVATSASPIVSPQVPIEERFLPRYKKLAHQYLTPSSEDRQLNWTPLSSSLSIEADPRKLVTNHQSPQLRSPISIGTFLGNTAYPSADGQFTQAKARWRRPALFTTTAFVPQSPQWMAVSPSRLQPAPDYFISCRAANPGDTVHASGCSGGHDFCSGENVESYSRGSDPSESETFRRKSRSWGSGLHLQELVSAAGRFTASCISKGQRSSADLLTSTFSALVRPLVAFGSIYRVRHKLDPGDLIAHGAPTVFLLGETYNVATQMEELRVDYLSKILFTYRRGFTELSSDIMNTVSPLDYSTHIGYISSSKEVPPEKAPRMCSTNTLIESPGTRCHTSTTARMENKDGTCSTGANTARVCSGSRVTKTRSSSTSLYHKMAYNRRLVVDSDVGWGCMVRATQMALAQTLLCARLGRSWRREALRLRSEYTTSPSSTYDELLEEEVTNYTDAPFQLNYQNDCLSSSRQENRLIAKSRIAAHTAVQSSGETPPPAPVSSFATPERINTHDTNNFSVGGGCTAKDGNAILRNILINFLDDFSSMLSLHRIVWMSCRYFRGVKVGDWLGPTSCAKAVGSLMQTTVFREQFPDIFPVVFTDGVIVHNLVRSLWSDQQQQRFSQCPSVCHYSSEFVRATNAGSAPAGNRTTESSASSLSPAKALLILCIRLGSHRFNVARYRKAIEKCFELRQFQGIAGGEGEAAAHYFVGACLDGLLYLDPHIDVKAASTSASALDIDDFFLPREAETIYLTPWDSLNPSMALYFLCNNLVDYEDLVDELRLISVTTPDLFEMVDEDYDYTRLQDLQVAKHHPNNYFIPHTLA